MANNAYSWYGEINVGTEASPNWYHLSQGILKNFNAKVDATSKSGSGTFRVHDKNGELWDILDALDGNGINQEFRLTFGDNSSNAMVFGGYTNSIQRPARALVFHVDHYMQLLSREISEKDKYQNQTGTYMVSDSTNGLIPKYFPAATTGVVPISVANHVDATAQDAFEYNADGSNLLLALKQIAAKSRRSGGAIPYDFYVNYDVTNTEKALWFNVKNDASFASGVTLFESSDFFDSFKLEEDPSKIINYWTVRGEQGAVTPIDRDWWTEANGTSDPTDRGWDYDGDCVNMIWSTSKIAGSQAMRGEFEDDTGYSSGIMILDLTNGNAFDSYYTPYPMVDGSGYYYEYDNLENLFVQFWMQDFDYSSGTYDQDAGSGTQFYVADSEFSVYNPVPPGGILRVTDNPNYYEPTLDRWDVTAPSLSYIEDRYEFFEIPLINGVISEQASGYIEGFQLTHWLDPDYDTWSGTDRLNIDGFRIVDKSKVTESLVTDSTYPGSDTSVGGSIASYGRRKAIFNDRTIAPIFSAGIMTDGNTKNMCNKIANKLLGFTKNPTLTFTAQLKNFYSALTPMSTFTLNIPSRGVIGASFRIHEISYTPAGQTIYAKPATFYDDANYDIGSVVAQIKNELDETRRRL